MSMRALKEAIVQKIPDFDVIRQVLTEKPEYMRQVIDMRATGTPLHCAAKADTAFCRVRNSVTELLLNEFDADPNICNVHNSSPAIWVCAQLGSENTPGDKLHAIKCIMNNPKFDMEF